jgi:hypothetical protein
VLKLVEGVLNIMKLSKTEAEIRGLKIGGSGLEDCQFASLLVGLSEQPSRDQ